MKEIIKDDDLEEGKTESKSLNTGVFEVVWMCPPGAINFFYSINGKAFIWDGKKKIDLPTHDLTKDQISQLRKLSIEVP